jgi:hypothetical protein
VQPARTHQLVAPIRQEPAAILPARVRQHVLAAHLARADGQSPGPELKAGLDRWPPRWTQSWPISTSSRPSHCVERRNAPESLILKSANTGVSQPVCSYIRRSLCSRAQAR